MGIRINEMPALQAQDDGFFEGLKLEVLDLHLETLGVSECDSLRSCIEQLMSDSEWAVDKGASLPFYIPRFDDEGDVRAYHAVPVWAGKHVDIPLYGDLNPEGVETLIKGRCRQLGRLDEGFLEFSPGFRVALLVHHITQMVVMDPFLAEAFVLGRYGEIPAEDSHYEECGIPSTELIRIESHIGTRDEWFRRDNALVKRHRSRARINGWTLRIRGSEPKEKYFIEAWQEMRQRLDNPYLGYPLDGRPAKSNEAAPSGRKRNRSGDPDVDVMVAWIEEKLEQDAFPMRGKFKDWQKAAGKIQKDLPGLGKTWTPEAMRKAYERRRRRKYQWR